MNEYITTLGGETRNDNLYRLFATNCDINKLADEIAANKYLSNRIFYLKDFVSESKLA